jgi:cobalt-zinc-cadmium efflux system outer membrane protein
MRGLIVVALASAVAGCQIPRADSVPAAGERQWSPPPPATAAGLAPGPPAGAASPSEVRQAGGQIPPPREVPAAPKTADPVPTPVLPPAGQAVTLAQLEQVALANNPTIAAAESLIRQQAGLRRQELLYPNPTAGYLRTDADQPGQGGSQGVFLSQDIVTAGKLRLAAAEHEREMDVSGWQLEAQRGRVVNDVRIRYYEVLGAQEAVAAAEELEKLAVEGVKVAEQLVQAKQAARPDVLQAEIQLNAIRSALQDARIRHQAAWAQLANVAGTPGLPMAPLADSLEKDIPRFEWQPTLDRLLAASPVLKAQESEIQVGGALVRLARAQAIPNLNVQVVLQRDHIQKYTSVSPLVSMPLPLFNRNQGNIQNAQAFTAQQRKEYERITLALRDQLAASFQQYQSARNQAERLKKDILPRVKENLDLTAEAYKLGQYDITRLINARQAYFETRNAYLDALTALHKVAVEIDGLLLTGGLNPTEIGTALQTPMGGGGGTGARSVLLQQLQQENAGGSRRLPGAVQGGR